MKKLKLLFLAMTLGILTMSVEARRWTSANGKKSFNARLKSYDPESGTVVVIKAGGKKAKFNQSILSLADIEYLKKKGAVTAEKPGSSSKSKVKKLPAVLPDPDGKEADMSKPVKVFILMGQSNMVGFGTSSALKGLAPNKFPYLVDDAGEWTARKDVRNVFVMSSGSPSYKNIFNDWLGGGNGSGAKRGKFGPEIGIGYYLGYVLDEPVLILKSCIGNRSLGYDLLPPSAVGTGARGLSYEGNKTGSPRTVKAGSWYAGVQYDSDTYSAQDVLKNIGKYYPGAKKYEIGGFFFWQGAKDLGKSGSAENYEKNLVHLINDLRKDYNAPNAPFVCATMGQAAKNSRGAGGMITDAQLAVDGTTGKYPKFKNNVRTFYSHPVSKGGANGHYGNDANTYMSVGEGMGKAMVELLQKR